MEWCDLKKKLIHSKYCYFYTKRGVLLCGDCLEVMKLLPNESIDLILTDPPYGVGSDELSGIEYKDEFYDVGLVSSELCRVLKNNSRAFVFTAQKTSIEVSKNFEDNGFKLHQTLVWFKPNLTRGTKKKVYDFTSVYEQILNFHKGKPAKIKKSEQFNNFDVLKYTQPQSNFKKDKRFHVHQKPLKLIEHLILVSSKDGNVILDCFVGSGTTCVTCEKLGRRWIGVEKNPKYCKIAKKRIKEEIRRIKIPQIFN